MTTPTDALSDERIEEIWRTHCREWPDIGKMLISPTVFARAIETEVRANECHPSKLPAILAAAPPAPQVREALRELAGAMQFVLAFYEPGQTYLDTEAWKRAEAGARRAHANARAALVSFTPALSEGEQKC